MSSYFQNCWHFWILLIRCCFCYLYVVDLCKCWEFLLAYLLPAECALYSSKSQCLVVVQLYVQCGVKLSWKASLLFRLWQKPMNHGMPWYARYCPRRRGGWRPRAARAVAWDFPQSTTLGISSMALLDCSPVLKVMVWMPRPNGQNQIESELKWIDSCHVLRSLFNPTALPSASHRFRSWSHSRLTWFKILCVGEQFRIVLRHPKGIERIG